MAQNNQITTIQKTNSQKFTDMVIREFASTTDAPMELSQHQQKLAQHLFLKMDASLREWEARRTSQNKTSQTPYTWENINLQKLAVDSVHRIDLGLDALVPNHIHPVAYFNGKEKKYDVDLRVGYVGEDYFRRQAALEPPIDIIYELVYSNDKFTVHKKGYEQPVESYEFDIKKPWDRGEVVGGFGYIMYEDDRKNKLVLVSAAEFDKSRKEAKSDKFWGKYKTEMQYKTLVHRVTSKIAIDPRKINDSFITVDSEEREERFGDTKEIEDNANQGEVIDIEPEEVVEEAQQEEAPPVPEEEPERRGPSYA